MVESVNREQRAPCSDLWVMKCTLKVLKRSPSRQQFNRPSQKSLLSSKSTYTVEMKSSLLVISSSVFVQTSLTCLTCLTSV